MGADIKGKIYEGLLEKMPRTPRVELDSILPRALIKTMVACIQPKPLKPLRILPAVLEDFIWLPTITLANNKLDREEKSS
jgi:type I restriction enzyme M protein